MAAGGDRIRLATGWHLQSSADVKLDGGALSRPGVDVKGWHPAMVPSTVFAALVAAGRYPDPYFGMNLRSVPGVSYAIGGQFANMEMPADSPFKPAWWYRDEFDVPRALAGQAIWLHFDGINYRATIWVNGTQIASSRDVAGAFRRYEFDVTPLVRPGERNAVAVEVTAPGPGDLGINWVDWNPTPPDKNMGLWGPVYLTESGPIALRHVYVNPALDVPSLKSADLTVVADVWNATDAAVTGTLRARFDTFGFTTPVTLGPKERKTIRVTPAQASSLRVNNPRVWWPYRMGTPELYRATVEVETGGVVSDRQSVAFGIRQVTSELTDKGHRLYRINGRPILIRGGGWASDMMERPMPPALLAAHMRYVKEMGLNTIRQEGKIETDDFYDLADREGVLVMPGWCCCDVWEQWEKWDDEDHRVGPASLRDQLLRLRNHPSIFVWLNGSDKPPAAAVERAYLQIEEDVEWNRPALSSAAEAPGPVSGPSGVKMRGPYDYVPPSYWLEDTNHGGAVGFATEIGPGAAVPPIESLQAMLPKDHLWPIDQFWTFHAGGGEFKNVEKFTHALEARYGKATGLDDYTRKAQALTYEAQRAMFEGYARNKYTSTGVIQWMLNNAWPSIIWHLYDYYMRPGGGYFGTKSACEPLHIQYSYDDRSVVVVNDTQNDARRLTAAATLLDFKLKQRFQQTQRVDSAADSVIRAFTIPEQPDLTRTYFLRLTLHDDAGRLVSTNFYWLSTRKDVLGPKSEWYYTPTTQHADLTALATLPKTTLTVNATTVKTYVTSTDGEHGQVVVQNTGSAIAFMVRLELLDSSGNEILPVFWQDNYVSLLPGERREIGVSTQVGARSGSAVVAEAWNVPSMRVPVR
ncbi:MAG: glycosyl hydrolase family 2 [Acidobacteria bacterium]|nr:MAG: glycosyl hydrolase family 2 [Acidobacteriota bacterium]